LPGRKILTLERWRDSYLRPRWAAAGMECAAEQFRRVKGYRRLPKLARALRALVTSEVKLTAGQTLLFAT
jgi:hypothetical protein